jgi:hypothetical protein
LHIPSEERLVEIPWFFLFAHNRTTLFLERGQHFLLFLLLVDLSIEEVTQIEPIEIELGSLSQNRLFYILFFLITLFFIDGMPRDGSGRDDPSLQIIIGEV